MAARVRYVHVAFSVWLALWLSSCQGTGPVPKGQSEPTQRASTPGPVEATATEGSNHTDVSVSTDQPEYGQGKTVRITVRNGLDASIWYAQSVDCGEPFWVLHACEGEAVQHTVPCLWEAPDHRFTELLPGDHLDGEWDGRIAGYGRSEPAERGCYRIVVPYALEQPEGLGEDWAEIRLEAESATFEIR